jgi:hypothetical protein
MEEHKKIQIVFELARVEATIVGFHSTRHRGIFTPGDSNIHICHMNGFDRINLSPPRANVPISAAGGMRSVSMRCAISASCSQNRRSPAQNGLENGFPLRGTEGSNPSPSSQRTQTSSMSPGLWATQ